MEFDSNFQSYTQEFLEPKAVDTVLEGSPLAMRVMGNQKKWRGRKVGKTIIVERQTNYKAFTGMQTFDTSKQDTKRRLEYDPRFIEIPVVIEGAERDTAASDPNASIEIYVEAMEESANSLAERIAEILFLDGTGTGNAEFLGLAALADDGGEVATIGGLSRSEYSVLQSEEYDLTGDITLEQIATAESATKKGSDRVTIHVTTDEIWDQFEALHQATVQSNVQVGEARPQVTRSGFVPARGALTGELGFDALSYRGKPVTADDQCPTGKWYGVNERWTGFYGLPSASKKYRLINVGGNKQVDGVYSDQSGKNYGFHFSGFMDSINQYGEVGHFLCSGNYVTWNPNRHFAINLS